MAQVAELQVERVNPVGVGLEIPEDKFEQNLTAEMVKKFEQSTASDGKPETAVRDATLAMIGDALVRVSLKKLIKTQQAFQVALAAFAQQVKEAGQATGAAAKKLAEEAIQLADSFRTKLIHYGNEVYKAILLYRDRTLEAARKAATVASEALSRATEVGVATSKAALEKLVIAKDATAKALQAAISMAVVLTVLAGLFVAECIRQVRDAINEILDELTLIGQAAYARIVVLYDSVVAFVKQLQDNLTAHLEKAKKARAERRLKMMKRLQKMKNEIYLSLLEELQGDEEESGESQSA